MQFDSPSQSPQIGALLTLVKDTKHNVDSVKRLFWLLNVHPSLVGHAQIFENLALILRTPVFEESNLKWASAWASDVEAWAGFCGWTQENLSAICEQDGLEDFAVVRPERHAMMRHGIVRHGFASGLWNRHEFLEPIYAGNAEARATVAHYQLLRAHLFAAHAECRFRTTSLEAFWHYDGQREPAAPVRTAALGRALRSISLAEHSPLLTKIPEEPRTEVFASLISRIRFNSAEDPEDETDSTFQARYAIQNYFRNFRSVLSGWRPAITKHSHSGHGAGGGLQVHGYTQLSSLANVYLLDESDKDASEDSDFPQPPGLTPIAGGLSASEQWSLETAGDAPYEEAFRFFPLAEPDKAGQTLIAERQQLAAIESAAQALPFNITNLTAEQLKAIDFKTRDVAGKFIHGQNDSEETRSEAAAALVIRLMLFYGQSLESALNIQLLRLLMMDDLGKEPVTAFSLAVQTTDLITETAIGFALPSISPTYRTRLHPSVEQVDGPACASFMLPEVDHLAEQLLAFRRKSPLAGNDITSNLFHIDASFVKSKVRDWFAVAGGTITPTKISRTLRGVILEQTSDQTLAWVVTADRQSANQTRMHYTRYPISTLVETHRKAVHRLIKRMDAEPPPRKTTLPNQYGEVGARFVISVDSLRQIVEALQQPLGRRYFANRTLLEKRNYHQRYLIYTLLGQALSTGYRPVNRVADLYLLYQQLGKSQSARTLWAISMDDKRSQQDDSSRLIVLHSIAREQFEYFAAHLTQIKQDFNSVRLATNQAVMQPAGDYAGMHSPAQITPFFTLSQDATYKPQAVNVEWITRALRVISGVNLPVNFHRAFLRTELLKRGCPPQFVDAFMGHANTGETPFARLSTFGYQQYRESIEDHLSAIHRDIGLVPMRSTLVPPQNRANA